MWGSSFKNDIVLNTRNGEGAGRRRETCGDLGLTSDEIRGQGNIDVAGLTVLIEAPSSRGPYEEAMATLAQEMVDYNRIPGEWAAVHGLRHSPTRTSEPCTLQ